MARVLITGGAGFIGAHTAGKLLAEGHDVRVLDALHPQGHRSAERPPYLHEDAQLICADIRDTGAIHRALRGIDRVVHLSARVGVGQSMYEIAEYTSANTLGTAMLLQALLDHPVEQL